MAVAPAGSSDLDHRPGEASQSRRRRRAAAGFSQARGLTKRAKLSQSTSELDCATPHRGQSTRGGVPVYPDAIRGTPLAFLVEAASVVKEATLIPSPS